MTVPVPYRQRHEGKHLPYIDARSQQTRVEVDRKGRKRYIDYKNLMIATTEEIDKPSLQALVDHVSSLLETFRGHSLIRIPLPLAEIRTQLDCRSIRLHRLPQRR